MSGDNKFEGLAQVRAERRKRLEESPLEVVALEPESTPPLEVPRKRTKVGKRSDPLYTLTSSFVKTALYDEVVLELMRQGRKREYSELINELLERWLEKQKRA